VSTSEDAAGSVLGDPEMQDITRRDVPIRSRLITNWKGSSEQNILKKLADQLLSSNDKN
jgi:hypothetical protein